jgi:hypothetical protein
MSGLPSNMDCSLLGTDNKEGTVPIAVVPFSNRMYIYIISSSLFAICCAIIFYVFFKQNSTLSVPTQTISVCTMIVGIASIVLYNLYDNTPSTFNFLFFGMMGIIITFCLLVYLIITDKYYLINSIRVISENVLSAMRTISSTMGTILSAIGTILWWVLNKLWNGVTSLIIIISNIKFNENIGAVFFGVAIVSIIVVALLANFGVIKTSTTR